MDKVIDDRFNELNMYTESDGIQGVRACGERDTYVIVEDKSKTFQIKLKRKSQHEDRELGLLLAELIMEDD